jgi:EmrB/QacA subfamily drug resistance transporter
MIAPAPANPIARRPGLALIGLTATVFVLVLDQNVLLVAIPTLLRDLHASVSDIQWVIAGYSLTFASLLVVAGRLGDLFGHRRMLLAGLALFAIGSLISALAGSWHVLLVGNALVEGVGAALFSAASLALINQAFTDEKRASAFALYGVMGGAAGAFGPIVGGWLTTDASWRWAFAVNVVLAPALVACVLAALREAPRSSQTARLDLLDLLLATAGLFLVAFAAIEAPRYGWWHSRQDFTLAGPRIDVGGLSIAPVALVAGLVVLAIFAWLNHLRDRRHGRALVPAALTARPAFRYGLITQAVLSVGEFGVFFVLAIVLQEQKGLSALQTGLWFVPFAVLIFVGAGIGVALANSLGPKRTVVVGMILETIGLVVLAFAISRDATLLDLLPGAVPYAIGAGFASAQLASVTLADVPPASAGVGSGLANTMRQVGSALGIAAIGAILVAHGSRDAILVAAAAVLAGVICSALIPSHTAQPHPAEPEDQPAAGGATHGIAK